MLTRQIGGMLLWLLHGVGNAFSPILHGKEPSQRSDDTKMRCVRDKDVRGKDEDT